MTPKGKALSPVGKAEQGEQAPVLGQGQHDVAVSDCLAVMIRLVGVV